MEEIQIEYFNAPCTVSGIDKPKSKPPQLLIQIEVGELCHTYCMAFGNAFGSKLPFIGSHEPAGVVVEVGSEVPGFAEGDRVGCLNFDSCCDSLDFPTAACMMCAGITMYGGIKRAQNAIFRDIKRIGSLVADKDATEELLELVVKHNIQVKIGEWKPDDAEKIRQEYLSGKVDMAAKLRSKRCQEQTSVKQWLIDNQLGICLGILAPLLIAQCNGLTRPLTAKLTSLSYRDEFTGEYGVGFDDNYLVAVLIVVLTGLRDATMRFVLDPLAAAWGLGRARSMRFKEQAWMVVYYATCWSVGTYIYASSSYWLDLQAMWTNWPNREISGLMKIYMLAQLAFWLQQMIVINIEKRRKDHWQMLSHHVVTIALVYCSYRYGLTRVGNVVLILMDFNDLVFSIAKCLKYMKLQSLCDFMFGAFVVSWVLCRHTAFPMVCWSVYAHSLAITGPNCFVGSGKNIIGPQEVPADGYFYLLEPLIYTNGRICYDYIIKTLFLSGLLFLEALMLVWFVMIVKLVIRVLRGGNAEDTRSDNEEEECEEDLPINVEVDAEKLQFPKKYSSGGKAQPVRHTSATRPGSMSSCTRRYPYSNQNHRETSESQQRLPTRTVNFELLKTFRTLPMTGKSLALSDSKVSVNSGEASAITPAPLPWRDDGCFSPPHDCPV
ncbi:sphingosine n-acyltransferase lag1 [Fusarium circinatum]|uniref:Sphingosine n-acyltransferase lag1 n=1 Tax=Fusarium circinatum TaxID=48490 RepID=A0A8H5U6B7_FUSCI|nr:sphingosine n-acyltransferase lag1 [Fusarium circinatum]